MLPVCAAPGAVPGAFAAQGETRLYNVYGDHMLFQQNEDAVFAGVAPAGTKIAVTLRDSSGSEVRSSEGTALENGTFTLSFKAPSGGFEAYSAQISANGSVFQTLSDIVFGELWLSSGQSNMEYILFGTPEGKQMKAEGKTGSGGIRILNVPHKMKDGVMIADSVPQTDVQGCSWFPADSEKVFEISAVAYFFAEDLIKKLDMPVGILNVAVGGSAIAPWISRQAIEGNPDVLSAMKKHKAYISLEEWDRSERSYYSDMTGLYNTKVAPLTNFRPAGCIWYQGETEIFAKNETSYYSQLFNLMQDSYTSLFSHSGGKLPFVFSQLAPYNYGLGPYGVTEFNEVFTSLVKEDSATRSEVVINDILPEYDADNHPIHPNNKKPVGERMSNCAFSLLYGGEAPSSSPYMTGAKVRDGSVFVEFANAGDGLMCGDDEIRGFSVYGDGGICVGAKAEIVSANTVRVYSDKVPDPKGAAYAVNSYISGVNLYSSYDNELYLPAASFGCGDSAITKLFDDADWLNCDTLAAWQCRDDKAGFKDVWKGNNASLSISDDRVQGKGSLKINGTGSFSAAAILYEEKDGAKLPYDSFDTDFKDYSAVSISFKNNGSSDITLKGIRIYGQTNLYFCPVCEESGRSSVVIPADSMWHEYTFNLNRLGFNGLEAGVLPNFVLGKAGKAELCFEGDNAEILCDGISFTPEGSSAAGSVISRIVSFFTGIFEKIRLFFINLF